MKRLIHLSSNRRQDGCAGGVELFAWYLQKAIPELEIVTSLPGNLDSKNTLVIADFHHAMRVPENIPVVCVIHGSMHELARRVDKLNDFRGVINAQHDACHRPNTHYMASSESALMYAQQHCELVAEAVVIPHGVDTDLFHSARRVTPAGPPYTILHAATDYVKNSDMVHEIGVALEVRWPGKYNVEFLDARIGEVPEKLLRGHCFVHPSHYEGDSYAILEAAAADLPVVCSAVGRYELGPHHARGAMGYVMDRNATAQDYAEEIDLTMRIGRLVLRPREWAIQYASFPLFAERWRSFLHGLL